MKLYIHCREGRQTDHEPANCRHSATKNGGEQLRVHELCLKGLQAVLKDD